MTASAAPFILTTDTPHSAIPDTDEGWEEDEEEDA